MKSNEIWLRKLKLRLRDKRFANHKVPVLPPGSNHFSSSWLFGAVAPRIYLFIEQKKQCMHMKQKIIFQLVSYIGYTVKISKGILNDVPFINESNSPEERAH